MIKRLPPGYQHQILVQEVSHRSSRPCFPQYTCLRIDVDFGANIPVYASKLLKWHNW